jgi:hypothetical protein
MNASQKPAGGASDPDESPDDQVQPIPDEDGPHDVPDDKVIEKTLPSKPTPHSGGSGSR